MGTNNQFYPSKTVALLETFLVESPFDDLSAEQKGQIQDQLVKRLGSTVFSYNGLLDTIGHHFSSSPKQEEGFAFYPVAVGDRLFSIVATAVKQWPDVHFREDDDTISSLEQRFPPVINFAGLKKVVLKWKKDRFAKYDPETNPIVDRVKKVNAYEHSTKSIPLFVEGSPEKNPSVGVRVHINMGRRSRLIERRTPSYQQVKKLLLKSVQETLAEVTPTWPKDQQEAVKIAMRRYEARLATSFQIDITDAFKNGWAQYSTHLDQKAIHYMQQLGLKQNEVYAYLMSAPDAKALEFRASAMHIFKRMGLPKYLTQVREKCIKRESWRDEGEWVTVPFRESIDEGTPAFEAIKLYDQDEKMWRRVTRLPVPPPEGMAKAMYSDNGYLSEVLKLTSVLPPSSQRDWDELRDFYHEAKRLYEANASYDEAEPAPVADLILRTWKATKNKPSTWREFFQGIFDESRYSAISGIGDTIRSLTTYVLGPVLARTGCENDDLSKLFTKRLLDRYNLHHLLSASNYWHSDRVRFQERLDSYVVDSDETWVSLIGEISSPRGIQFANLISRAQLWEEGQAMLHCVYSYTDNCVRGKSHIISLRDKNGMRLSTLELYETSEGKVKNVQHQAYQRREPSSEAIAAAEWLVKEINEGRIKPDYAEIRRVRAKFQTQRASSRLGFDVNDLEKCEEIFTLYHPCLPPRVRERVTCIADFFKEIGFDADLKERNIPLLGQNEAEPERNPLPASILALLNVPPQGNQPNP